MSTDSHPLLKCRLRERCRPRTISWRPRKQAFDDTLEGPGDFSTECCKRQPLARSVSETQFGERTPWNRVLACDKKYAFESWTS
jgi:hypothetical protein